ncbi:MAG: ATP-binding protein [Gemmatimonadetes bacterium]|nr:ATP-binding protein [Gemmatimonadota bacterium]MBK8057668.1 ATP-binding protein [Gemmatimonadota bacterium]MBK8646610.1 ATP-binding protein [Gemmatimonadota bacterium]
MSPSPDAPPTSAAREQPEDRPRLLGRVVATERRPNTTHEFHFWTALDSPVGIGTIVRVEGTHAIEGQIPQVYGVVTDGMSYSDLASPLHDVIGFDADPARAARAATERAEIRLYTAAVLRHIPDEPLQPVAMGQVFLADDRDVAVALRMDGYLREGARTGIPVGVYRAGGMESPIYLDADFLLGPEAAHLNITGVSGLATKTSAVEWLLASIFAHFPAKKGSVAAVCFNVKGPDLCFLDQPSTLEARDRTLYEALGVPAAPFPNVHYFAPYKAKGYALNTLRSNPALQHNVSPLTWGLREVMQFAEVLLNKDDIDAKADALIDFVASRVVDQPFSDPLMGGRQFQVRSFADLDAFFRELIDAMEGANREQWRTHHVATIRKVRNRLVNIATRCEGLVTNDGHASDLPFGSFEDRAVYVIDVANLEEDAQDLIFARVVSKLREHLERRALGVDHLVVFVDELNKYAPADGPETYVRKMLLDIAERGRYLGLVLFSAQQFRSQVHRRVVGNSGTAIYGRMDPDELATPGYAVIGPSTRTKLATLDKGQLMVRHPHFAQPIFVRFPRPAVLSGREGAERFPQGEEPTLQEAVLRQLRTLDPQLTMASIATVFEGLYRDDEILRARDRTMRERPSDVKGHFLSQFRSLVASRVPAPSPVRPLRPAPLGDPYGT